MTAGQLRTSFIFHPVPKYQLSVNSGFSKRFHLFPVALMYRFNFTRQTHNSTVQNLYWWWDLVQPGREVTPPQVLMDQDFVGLCLSPSSFSSISSWLSALTPPLSCPWPCLCKISCVFLSLVSILLVVHVNLCLGGNFNDIVSNRDNTENASVQKVDIIVVQI